MSDKYLDEIQPLFKLLRNPAFRFVIVCYNHYDLVRRLERDLRQQFPDRPFRKLNAQKTNYQELSKAYFALDSGFFWLENFDDVLKEEHNSLGRETPEMALQNERRRHIAAGLNLRRDKLAKTPVALFVFIPTTAGELFARRIMEKMPDLWSFRSLILDLRQELSAANVVIGDTRLEQERFETSTLGGAGIPEKEAELHRLLEQLEQSPRTETAYLLTLYPQITELQNELGYYTQALATLEDWEQLADEGEKGHIWEQKGNLYINSGNLNGALDAYQKMETFFSVRLAENAENPVIKNNLAISCQNLGNTYSALGNLEKALAFYEQYNQLEKELHESAPENVSFKNGLAISYSKLGDTQSELGNLEEALTFYEQYNQLEKELHESTPENVSFKNGLAISYERLGDTQRALGNVEAALAFYEDETKLFEELHESAPENVSFKNGLALSYCRLGDTHLALGNLEKALAFCERYHQLAKELHESFPQNVSFENNLAFSYYQLGQLYEKKGNLEQALEYFEQDLKFAELVFQRSPRNAEYRSNLRISYDNMAKISEKLGKTALAQAYREKAESFGKA